MNPTCHNIPAAATRVPPTIPWEHVTANETNKPAAIRYAEKRRISTCGFADRVAQAALHVYRKVVSPAPFPTCIAAILLYNKEKDDLSVLALGVGTKFLPDQLLREEEGHSNYGHRVRDLHAEVLCRRAFRRYLSEYILNILQDDKKPPDESRFVERTKDGMWELRPAYTLHAYFSSAPCGNATVKKFVTLSKEVHRPDLTLWPTESHPPHQGHSIHLGQFALLLKKDSTAARVTESKGKDRQNNDIPAKNVPAGTSTVMKRQGSLHTCSDKICRWNLLGWQGSLLAGLFTEPLGMETITVGRKFSAPCLQRALCCRVAADTEPQQIHHPAIMCTAVYVDPDAVIVPQSVGNDMQFVNSQGFVWWAHLSKAQAIDGNTGYASTNSDLETSSSICTARLFSLFLSIQKELGHGEHDKARAEKLTLAELRSFKRGVSPEYEAKKDQMLRHKVMKHWVRRSALVDSEHR